MILLIMTAIAGAGVGICLVLNLASYERKCRKAAERRAATWEDLYVDQLRENRRLMTAPICYSWDGQPCRSASLDSLVGSNTVEER